MRTLVSLAVLSYLGVGVREALFADYVKFDLPWYIWVMLLLAMLADIRDAWD